jgi:hypothetical protein
VSLGSLPDDVVGVILAHLSLMEVPRIFTICWSLHTVYRQRIAAGQKFRFNLAEKSWGHARIVCIVTFIALFLEGRRVHPDFVNTHFCDYHVSMEGLLYAGLYPLDAARICTSMRLRNPGPSYAYPDEVRVEAHNLPNTYLTVQVWRNRKGAHIMVKPKSDGDLGGVALLQALLSGGLAKAIQDVGQHAEVSIVSQLGCTSSHGKGWKHRWRRFCRLPHATRREAGCCPIGVTWRSACTLGRSDQGLAKGSLLGLNRLPYGRLHGRGALSGSFAPGPFLAPQITNNEISLDACFHQLPWPDGDHARSVWAQPCSPRAQRGGRGFLLSVGDVLLPVQGASPHYYDLCSHAHIT